MTLCATKQVGKRRGKRMVTLELDKKNRKNCKRGVERAAYKKSRC